MKFKDDDVLSSWKYIIPLGIIVFLIPLIIRLNVVVPTTIERKTWKQSDFYADFFSYNKGKVLIILSCIAFFYMLYALLLENIILKKTIFYVPMAFYLIFAILSSFMSEHRHISLFGFAERYEGLIILSIYMLLLFLAINLTNSKKSLIIVLSLLFISALIICTIGLFQYFGYDLFKSYIGRKLILPAQYADAVVNVGTEKGTLYSTLMNSNYIGSYIALTLPLLMTLMIYCKDKKFKLLFLILLMINFATLIGSNSRTGFIGILAGMFFYILFRVKHIIKPKDLIIFLLMIILLFVAFIGLNKVNNNRFYNSLTLMYKQLKTPSMPKKLTLINDISLKDNNTVKFSLDKENLYMYLDSKFNFKFTDEKDNVINYEKTKDNNIVLKNDNYKSLVFSFKSYDNKPVVILSEGYLNVSFILENNTIKYFLSDTLTMYDIKQIPSIGFKGRETLGSGRGYIWSRTLPMLKDTILLGKGPDTYCIYFPQQDFITKLNLGVNPYIITDKPHNFYMGTAFNTGILSLIALLVIFIMYFIKCCKLYFNKNVTDFYNIIGFGIFLSNMAYLTSCMFNDSTLGVAPVFWILLGCGIAINMKLDKKKKKDSDLLL